MKHALDREYSKLCDYCKIDSSADDRKVEQIFGVIKRAFAGFLKQCQKPAIWCYGSHTKMLMADFMFELKDVRYIIDNSIRNTEGSGFELLRETDILPKQIDGVIISSKVFRNEIKERLKTCYENVRFLDIYDELENAGIFMEKEYYKLKHPYYKYSNINELQRSLEIEKEGNAHRDIMEQIIQSYIKLKDFYSAIFYARKLEARYEGEREKQLVEKLVQIYEMQMEAIKQISGKHVLMLCIDGLRRSDVDEECMKNLYKFLKENTRFFCNAYAVSTSTFESLIPAYSENADMRTKYYEKNDIPSEQCRFIQEAKRQGRNIFFYTDGVDYISDKDIKVTQYSQTVTEKMWDFVMDALEEENGLFYIHVLYESHFSYPNPYTKERIIAQGTHIMFDYLEREGGEIQTDYIGQHRDALKYLDDVLVPLIERLSCRMVVYADHGGILLERETRLEDVEDTKYTFHEELIRVPIAVRAKEVETGWDETLISIMELNNIIIGLLNEKEIASHSKGFVKVLRSELYNPDFQYLYRKTGNEQGLLAFEVFLFEEGYKLAIYSNGVTELYLTESDYRLNDIQMKEELLSRVKNEITVCSIEKAEQLRKIFFIIYSFSMGGGAEALLTQIVNHLNPEKYKVAVMEIIHADIKQEPVDDRVKLYPYYIRADDPERKSKMYYVYHEWDQVIEKCIPPDYDLYVSFNYLTPSFLLPKGKKCIAWIHGDVYDLANPELAEEWKLQDEAFEKADRIVAISDITRQSLEELFPRHREKLRVICNGIDVERIRKEGEEPVPIQMRHPAVLSIGRLDKNKNPLRMLNIFEKAYKKNPNAHLYYLGRGNLERDVRRLAEEKGIGAHVHLLGYYDNPYPIISQCDVSCLFSFSEGFPIALLESVALDKPFVSSVVGGARILANGQRCGRTVETDEEGAAAILELIQADRQQIIRECRESIERFELKKYIAQIESMFEELL